MICKYRLLKCSLEISMHRSPAKFTLNLRGIDRITPVVTGTVLDPIEIILGFTHRMQNRSHHTKVAALAVGTDQICLPYSAAR